MIGSDELLPDAYVLVVFGVEDFVSWLSGGGRSGVFDFHFNFCCRTFLERVTFAERPENADQDQLRDERDQVRDDVGNQKFLSLAVFTKNIELHVYNAHVNSGSEIQAVGRDVPYQLRNVEFSHLVLARLLFDAVNPEAQETS